jgi:hypothetical protein
MLPAFIGTFFIKEIPLREHSGLDATRMDDDALVRAETAVV